MWKTGQMLGPALVGWLCLLGGVSSVWPMAAPTDIVANDAETDGVNGFTELAGAFGVAMFSVGGTPYAIVAGQNDDGVQIINLSAPTNITAVDAETDGVNGFTELAGAFGVAMFSVGGTPYAIVASFIDDGVQIINLSAPTNITAADAETDGVNGFTELDGAVGVATFSVGGTPYAIVASSDDVGVQIINLSDPTNITAVDAETDGVNGFTELNRAFGVAMFSVGGTPYAIVASQIDDGVQIINLSAPTNITAADAETDGVNGFTELDGASGVAIFTDTTFGSTHAIVTAFYDDGVQIVTLDGTVPVELLDFRVR